MDWNFGKLNERYEKPKFLQITDRVIEAIQSQTLGLGDHLPSINQAMRGFSVSRDTVVKAYNELKKRGLIEATPNKAYFVSNIFVSGRKQVLLIVDDNTPYKETVYSGLLDALGSDYYVDFVSHNDDFDLLKNIYERSKYFGKHAAYLIVPTAVQLHEREYFHFIKATNILFIDRAVSHLPIPFVRQSFNSGFLRALGVHVTKFDKYNEIVFVTKKFTNPIVEEMKQSLSNFAKSIHKPFSVQTTLFTDKQIEEGLVAQPGVCYFVLHPQLLVYLIQSASKQNLVIGKNIGIIAINDEPVFKILCGGITVLSADFEEMGRRAAKFVLDGNIESTVVETRLILRESL